MRCYFSLFYHCLRSQLDPPGPETRPGGRPGPQGACYVLRRYMPFSVARKGLITKPSKLGSLRVVGPTRGEPAARARQARATRVGARFAFVAVIGSGCRGLWPSAGRLHRVSRCVMAVAVVYGILPSRGPWGDGHSVAVAAPTAVFSGSAYLVGSRSRHTAQKVR